jgi:putative SOS response-associated peptidase YedK
LLPEHIDAWLNPAQQERDRLQAILSERAVTLYQHATLQAA